MYHWDPENLELGIDPGGVLTHMLTGKSTKFYAQMSKISERNTCCILIKSHIALSFKLDVGVQSWGPQI